jgi:predicted amidophosphoribosyltransferase
MEHPHTCKYCGNKTSRLDICSNCHKRLPLVRQLLAMVRAKKEEIDKQREGKK